MKKTILFSMLLLATLPMACCKEEPEPQDVNIPSEVGNTHDIPTEQPAL